MRLSEPMERSGLFWLPERPEDQLQGDLRISESGEVTLEVNYIYDPRERLMNEPRIGYPPEGSEDRSLNRIVGIVDNDPVTLDECRYVNWRKSYGATGGVSNSIIRADRAFVGVNYDGGEEVAFSNINFSVEGLDEWLSVSGFQVERDSGSGDRSIRYSRPEDIVLNLPDGIQLRFTFAFTSSLSGFTEARITQKAYVSLSSEGLRSFDYYEKLIKKIHNFFRFVTDEIVSIDEITGYSSEITRSDLVDGERYRIPIKMYYQRLPHPETRPEIHWPHMLFRYRDVTDKIEDILTKWLHFHDVFEPAFNLYFASKSGTRMFLESIFLSLAQGLETLHRKNSVGKPEGYYMPEDEFSKLMDDIMQVIPGDRRILIKSKLRFENELSLRKRIKSLIEPFSHYFGNESKQRYFINKFVETRNYLTHYDNKSSPQAASGQDLLDLSRQLEALFQLQILILIGIEHSFIDLMVDKNRTFLRQKLGL